MNWKFKSTAFIWNRIFCDIINVTFDLKSQSWNQAQNGCIACVCVCDRQSVLFRDARVGLSASVSLCVTQRFRTTWGHSLTLNRLAFITHTQLKPLQWLDLWLITRFVIICSYLPLNTYSSFQMKYSQSVLVNSALPTRKEMFIKDVLLSNF